MNVCAGQMPMRKDYICNKLNSTTIGRDGAMTMKQKLTLCVGGKADGLQENMEERVQFKKVPFGYEPSQVNEHILTLHRQCDALRMEAEQLRTQFKAVQAELQQALKLSADKASTQRQTYKARIEQLTRQLNQAKAKNITVLQQLEQAQIRERACAIRCNRNQATITKLKEAIDSNKMDSLQVELGEVTRERDQYAAQVLVIRKKNEQLGVKLEHLHAEKQSISQELLSVQEKAETYRHSVIDICKHNNGTCSEMNSCMDELSQLFGSYTKTLKKITDQAHLSVLP